MITLNVDLTTGVAKIATSSATIKVGADVPVRVVFASPPGEVSGLEFALGQPDETAATLAYTNAFNQESDRSWRALLDATDSRLSTFLTGKQTDTVVAELVAVVDGERRVTPNLQVVVQQPIVNGPETTEGGPTYFTDAETLTAIAAQAVRYDAEQGLSTGQTAQARENIHAAPYGTALLFHSSGPPSVFDAAGGTDAARGAALVAAKAAAIAGERIVAGAGGYDVTASLAKDQVNWSFAAGASVVRSGGFIFSDGGVAMTFSIEGFGSFHGSESGATGGGVLSLANAASSVKLHGSSLQSTATGEVGSAVLVGVGDMDVTADLIQTNGGDYCVWWQGGNWFINARRIYSSSEGSHAISCQGLSGKKLWINADEIANTGAGALGAIATLEGSHALSAVWVFAKEIRANGNTSNPTIDCRNGKLYVNCQKITATTGAPFSATGANSLLYVNSQKVEAGLQATLSAGQSWLDILQFIDGGAPTGPMVLVSGGTHNFRTQEMKVAATAVSVSGGTLRQAGRIDTSASATSNPILKSGGTLILDHSTLVGEGTRNAIEAASAQNVKCYGVFSNRPLDADVTNQIDGGFTEDADVA